MGLRRKGDAYRIASQRSDSRLTRSQIKAAYRLYKAGMGVPAIAELIWEHFGYASPKACVSSLYYAFYSYKLPVRSIAEANRLSASQRCCAGCGCLANDRTKGCDTCKSRHGHRRRSGLSQLLFRGPGCVGCGCPYHERTPCCKQCKERYRSREKRSLTKAA
jgi:hypothetical protein